MNASEPRQFIVIKRLHTEADAVDAGTAKRGEAFRRGGFWIRLERDLRVHGDIEGLATRRDQALDLGGIEQRRRAPSEENGVCSAPWCAADFELERRHIPPFQLNVEEASIEVAVRTNRLAERNMEIKTESGVHLFGLAAPRFAAGPLQLARGAGLLQRPERIVVAQVRARLAAGPG